jgi:hypothetical protein
MRLKVLLGVCVLLGGWMAKGVVRPRHVQASAPAAVTVPTIAEAGMEPTPTIAPVGLVDSRRSPSRSDRNLFSYREAPPVVVTPIAPPVAIPVAVATVAPPPPAEPEEPAIAPFPWRYIGRFGREDNPVAAFVRDGDVKTVRIGDRIDAQYVLRGIGIESVDVESDDAGTERIELAVNEPLAAQPATARPLSNPRRKQPRGSPANQNP